MAAYILTQVVAGVAGLALYAIASGTSGFSASESGFASNGYAVITGADRSEVDEGVANNP